MKSSLVLRCDGLSFRSFDVPPFELNEGDFVQIQCAESSEMKDFELLRATLSGRIRASGIELRREATCVDSFGGVEGKSVVDSVNRKLISANAEIALRRFREFRKGIGVQQLSSTARMLFALAVALERCAFLVYSVTLDPLGELAVRDFLRECLGGRAVIEINRFKTGVPVPFQFESIIKVVEKRTNNEMNELVRK